MLAELQQKFFETFDIPKVYKTSINTGDLDLNYVEIQAPTLEKLYEEAQYDLDTPIFFSWFKRSKRWSEEYPQITDRQYLELICILSTYMNEIDNIQLITAENIDYLKEHILKDCIVCKDKIKNKIEMIFKD